MTQMHFKRLSKCLIDLYGDDRGTTVFETVTRSLPAPVDGRRSSPKVILSAYPDAIVDESGGSGLYVLDTFLRDKLEGAFSDVHVLPPYVHSGDFGFAVDDHRRIRKEAGTAGDLASMRSARALMLDFVVNHVGVGAPAFQAARAGDARASAFFIHDNGFDTTKVMRGETPFRTYRFADGDVRIWSTFTENQVDLDYRNPEVFVEMAAQLAAVVAAGADGIRLDALVFAWKESGTSCAGLPEVAVLATAFRAVAELVRPGIVVLGEVDLRGPGAELVQAGVVDLAYRYELPVQLAYALVSQDPRHLRAWLQDAANSLDAHAGLLVLGTHDGLFLRPYDPPLPPDAIDTLVREGAARGGIIREMQVAGVSRPYEIDIAFPDLLGGDHARFLGAVALLLALPGVPMLTLRNVVGAASDHTLAEQTGEARAVNRGQVDIADVDPTLVRSIRDLVLERAHHAAFAPDSPVSSIEIDGSVLIFIRGEDAVGVLANLGAERTRATLGTSRFMLEPWEVRWCEISSGRTITSSASLMSGEGDVR